MTGCVGIATALTIRFVRLGSSRLTDFGLISYSLYLLHVPIGVVRVVAGDMLGEGLLESFQPSTNVADDVLLITRLIAGVRNL